MLLATEDWVEIAGECDNGTDAIAAIQKLKPDLVFLDVQMPGATGFDVITNVGVDRMPPVVFVTAYDRYALRAFDVHALDYLLKPFDRERFQQALSRARQHLERHDAGELERRLLELVQDLRSPPQRPERFVIKSGGRVFFVRTDEIDWIEAAGNYVKLHVGAEAHLLRETMNALEAQLDPDVFFRIHRCHIVNIERVRGAAAVVQRRVRRVPAERRAADAEPGLSGEAPGSHRQIALAAPSPNRERRRAVPQPFREIHAKDARSRHGDPHPCAKVDMHTSVSERGRIDRARDIDEHRGRHAEHLEHGSTPPPPFAAAGRKMAAEDAAITPSCSSGCARSKARPPLPRPRSRPERQRSLPMWLT